MVDSNKIKFCDLHLNSMQSNTENRHVITVS